MRCTACKKEYNKKDIVYTVDRLSYCSNPFTCNDDHPNSVKNIVARGGAIKMFTEDELEDNILETLDVTPKMKERIIKLATKPQSIRLSKWDIAHYLISLQDSKGMASISEAVRYCVSVAMKDEPIESVSVPVEVFKGKTATIPVVERAKEELEPIEHDVEEIEQPTPMEPVLVPNNEEDEFTF